jgi:hypothetical protein
LNILVYSIPYVIQNEDSFFYNMKQPRPWKLKFKLKMQS